MAAVRRCGLQMTVDDWVIYDVRAVGVRLDAIELCGFDQEGGRCPASDPTVGACETARFFDRADRSIDDAAVDLGAAVVKEAK